MVVVFAEVEDGVVVAVSLLIEGKVEGIDRSFFTSSGASTLGLNNDDAREDEAGRSGGCFESEAMSSRLHWERAREINNYIIDM